MKNIMKNKNISNALVAVLFVSAVSFGAIGFAPAAHAQYDDFGGGFTDSCCGGSDVVDGYSGYTPSYGSDVVDGYSSYTPSYGSDVVDGYSTYSPSYDNGYSTPSYSTGGYSTGGYSTGGFLTSPTLIASGYPTANFSTPIFPAPIATPVISTPSNSTVTVTAPTTVTDNTCTGNSCNSDDHSVVNIQNPAPVINNNNVVANYAQPVAQSYPTYPTQQYRQPIPVYQQPPMAYNNTPYVSLSQVPYTGLDLGFWGSIVYWGAFILFALFAAYLIAIKRVQNNIANYLKSVLFGSDEEVLETSDVVTAPAAPAPAPEATQGDVIDSFIMSQINRARHA